MTGKQRASRIPLDYYKKLDSLTLWKLGLSGIALVCALAWLSAGLVAANGGRMRSSHGPVARVHAAWDAKCEACHAPFSSITGEAWPSAIGFKPGDATHKCSTCHAVATHSPNMIAGQEASCASCHQDHRGRDNSLLQVDDSRCKSCHADLKEHIAAGKSRSTHEDADRIVGFPNGHPAFHPGPSATRVQSDLSADPGPVRFNHSLHMSPGLNDAKLGKPIFKVGQLAEADRAKYGVRPDQSPNDAVTLTSCTPCHELGGMAARGKSDYRAISFANDCAACHPLVAPVAAARPVVDDANGRKTEPKIATFQLPHKVQPEAIRTYLRNAAIGELMEEIAHPKAAQPLGLPLPGRDSNALKKLPAEAEIARRLKNAETFVFGPGKATCTECHRYTTPSGIKESLPPGADLQGVRIATLADVRADPLAPAKLPLQATSSEPAMADPLLLGRAWFNHSAHEGVNCRECHAQAYPRNSAEIPSRSSDLMLPSKDTCAKCHAPEGSDPNLGVVGGVDHNCISCHRYHGIDDSRSPVAEGRSIKEFLQGDSSPAKGKDAEQK